MPRQPVRGEVWLVNLDPVVGHEQGRTRPAVIVSTDLFNQGPAGLVFLLPITSTERGIPFHIEVNPPEGGVRERSFVLCDQLRAASKERLIRPWGVLSPRTMAQVEDTLRILLDL